MSVQLVSLAGLDGTMLPSPPGLRTISGVVVTMTSTGKQPVAGTWVDFEPDFDNDWPAANTLTNAKGEFALCALPQSAVNIAAASYPGPRFAYAIVPPGQTTIELMLR